MPRKTINFELDFMIKDIFPRFTVKQFDDVSFNIKPKNQGLDYDTTGMTGKIFVGVDNDMFMQTTGITVSSNNINVILDKNMLQNRGRAYAEIELTDNNGTITSSSFIFNIDEKIGEGAKIPEGYEGFVAKYERLISQFKSQVNSTISNCNSNVNSAIKQCNSNVDNKLNAVDSLVNAKISDLENRFNRLTSSQQQEAEVILAREDFKGQVFDSLKERIDYTDKILRESTVSTVETESDFTVVEQTSNGYFEDVKLEGKTLVNLVNYSNKSLEGSAWNNFVNIDCLNSMLKQSTEYTIIAYVEGLSANKIFSLHSSTTHGLFETSGINIRQNGMHVFKWITKSEFTNMTHVLFTSHDPANNVGTFTLSLCIIEGDHTQNPPSYFEGLKSVGDNTDEIVVSSVNGDGNLFDGELEIGTVNSENGTDQAYHLRCRNKGFIAIKENLNYSIKVPSNYFINRIFYYGSSYNYISNLSIGSNQRTFTTPSGARYLRFAIGVQGDSNISQTNLVELRNTLELKCGELSTEYTPHEADEKQLLFYNTETQTWEKPVLREWDSIEKHSDGKYYYHKRSEEVVFDGSENWFCEFTKNNTIAAYTIDVSDKTNNDTNVISDKFPTTSQGLSTYDLECIKNANGLYINVLKSRLATQDVGGFKQWLQANPVTVVYQLAQEKVYECTNIDLITYANETNYIVESGAIVPKSTLKVHNNISNVVSLLQKKVSLLESNITNYMITQNRLQLASTYSADSVTFKVDYYAMYNNEAEEYNNDLYDLILNNILVGKDNYNYDKMFTMILDYASWNQISWEQFDILVGLMDMQHNPPIEELPTEDEIEEDVIEEEAPVE